MYVPSLPWLHCSSTMGAALRDGWGKKKERKRGKKWVSPIHTCAFSGSQGPSFTGPLARKTELLLKVVLPAPAAQFCSAAAFRSKLGDKRGKKSLRKSFFRFWLPSPTHLLSLALSFAHIVASCIFSELHILISGRNRFQWTDLSLVGT